MSLLAFLVSFIVSTVGAICGIGGGPINLVILYHFFNVDKRSCAKQFIHHYDFVAHKLSNDPAYAYNISFCMDILPFAVSIWGHSVFFLK